jgi:putative lipoic acid-binding regulatory protein
MYFSGGESTSIQIHANKEGILGPSDLQLRCDYSHGSEEEVIGSNIQAKINDVFKTIASFEKDSNGKDPTFSSNGIYLSSRANLSNPTPSLPNTVILTFNQIECEDEREYICTVTVKVDGDFKKNTSNAISIVVKGKYT